MVSTISVRGEPEQSVWTSLYELLNRITCCWISFSISDRKLGTSGRLRQRGWRCIIGPFLSKMGRGCIRLTCLTFVCEVIRYRLVQVRQNLKKDFSNSGWRPTIAFLYLFLFSPLHPYTHRTQRLVWVPWCDSRNWASQSSTEVASWQRKGQIASRIARQKMKAGCERHGERESESKREDKEWPNAAKQERQSDATNLNSKTWCERSRQNAALLE